MSQNMTELGRGVEQHVQDARRLAQVNEDVQHAHDDRRHGQEFPQDDDAAEFPLVVQVKRQHHHDRGSGHAHQKGELRDIESPDHIAAHPGDAQSVRVLMEVTRQPHGDRNQQARQPELVTGFVR